MNAPRYDRMRRNGMDVESPDAATRGSNEAIYKAMQEWCNKQNLFGHRKRPGTSTCLDCGTDLDR